jgi:hypothetical protein
MYPESIDYLAFFMSLSLDLPGWVDCPNRNVADFDAHKISYLTCGDCLDLSIFYAGNSTMHMDQIQWK